MKIIIISFLIILFLSNYSNEAETDCVKTGGKNGKECKAKSTFLNVAEWNFIIEDDLSYMCCYYKGKLGDKDYEGCFAFYEEDIKNNKVNDLLDDMEKGRWELALGESTNEPSIDCFSNTLKFKFKIFLFLFELLGIFFI